MKLSSIGQKHPETSAGAAPSTWSLPSSRSWNRILPIIAKHPPWELIPLTTFTINPWRPSHRRSFLVRSKANKQIIDTC
jgi:hypothetical protein